MQASARSRHRRRHDCRGTTHSRLACRLAARTSASSPGRDLEALVLSDRPGPFQFQIPYFYISFPH